MQNPEYLERLRQGSAAWNFWRVANPLLRPNFSGEIVGPAALQDTNLSSSIFTAAVLDGADLRGALLREANLAGAALRDADLRGAILTQAWLFQTNLRQSRLEGANLRGANLSQAILRLANLERADARHASFGRADLNGARLAEANLGYADFGGANLANADLREANLSGANLSGANLSGANLDGATLGWTRFGDLDLSVVAGLETTRHIGPSSVGIDTIYRSKAKIPDPFLRGAGLPEIFLTFMASLVGQPIEFFACYISNSLADRLFCERLYADLQAKGVRTWFLPEDRDAAGAGWAEVDRGIKIYDKLVVVCSEHSLRSPSVVQEIELALEREADDGQQVLYPINIDDFLCDAWRHPAAEALRERLIGDFRGWSHDAERYSAQLEQLIEVLKAPAKPRAPEPAVTA